MSLALPVIGAATPNAASADSSYRYESVSAISLDTSVIRIDIANKVLVYPATLTELEACPGKRNRCFKTTRMSFCSPTELEIRAGAWNCGDDDLGFHVTGERTLHIIGNDIHTLVISSHGTEYFFNRERGLVMFRFIGQPITEVYWSTSPLGFGSINQEAELRPD
ncbi:hypothetical protein [Stenotrophomonas oahuensis]|uniref:Uncharacterized protein n=1 Tax=Stenotrophomonas oahuensis TaxID=3003271 RepID=A0ABY9YN33_9GAMM|nr:hypothetical protein [Stenotrophomonas sp. A5586]WNH52299.1 hypothetical protein PDM29_18515 [Stenotrophomonas sp. A5586]